VNNRLMKHYDTVLKWCRVFLQGESFTNWKGNGRVNAILFPMNEVFESYVTSVLRQSGIFDEFKAQSRDKYLAEENGKGIFQLIPDITASAGDTFYIMDAKWKLINGSDRVNKYGVSQSDMYQLLSYAKIYGKDHPDIKMALIYPANENFNEPISFKYNDAAGILLTLWPFDIDRSVKESGYCRDWTVNSMRIQGSP